MPFDICLGRKPAAVDRIAQFARAQAVATQIIGSITDEQLTLPTPCTEWNVRDILNHVLDGDLLVIAWLQGETPPWGRDVNHLGGTDPQAVVPLVLEWLAACYALAAAEAGDLERVLTPRMGPMSVDAVVARRVDDLVAHLWDLAIVTGQPVDYDPELVESVLAHYHERLDGMPREGKPVAEPQPVPEGATAADRLAAYLGRPVGAWRTTT
jgi:uncharacterized protein (TIGR03086 family)